MQVIFYSNLAEVNRVDKSDYINEIATVEGRLRSRTSVVNPTIEFDIPVVSVYRYIWDCNYIYIPEFCRYYFVNDKSLEYTGLITFSCTVDVLMTFKKDLMKLNAFIVRNEKILDTTKYLKDNDFPIKSAPSISTRFLDLCKVCTDDGTDEAWYVVNVVNNQSFLDSSSLSDDQTTQNSSVTSYCMSRKEMKRFYDVVIADSEKMSYIVSIYMITSQNVINLLKEPVTTYCESVTSVPLGTVNVEANAVHVFNNDGFDEEDTVDLNLTHSIQDYEPFKKYSIVIPGYGGYDIDLSAFVGVASDQITGLTFRSRYDFQTGSVTILIYANTAFGSALTGHFETFSFAMFPQIPKNYDDSDQVERRSTANAITFASAAGAASLRAAGNAAGSALNLNFGGAAAAAGNLAADLVTATGNFFSQETLNVPYGKTERVISIIDSICLPKYARFGNNQARFMTVDYVIQDMFDSDFGMSYAKLHGYRCFEYKPLSTLTGYTVVGDIHLENIGSEDGSTTAMSGELVLLDRLLKTGVIL